MLKLIDSTNWRTLSRHKTLGTAYDRLAEHAKKDGSNGYAIMRESDHVLLISIGALDFVTPLTAAQRAIT